MQCKSQGARVWLGVICFLVEYKKFLVNNTRHRYTYIHKVMDFYQLRFATAPFCFCFSLLIEAGHASQAAARSQASLSLAHRQSVISNCSQLLSHCSPASNQSHARNRRQLLAHNPISRPLTNNHNNQTISRNYFRRRKSERRGKFCFHREPAGTAASNELFAHLLRRLKRALCSKNSVKST